MSFGLNIAAEIVFIFWAYIRNKKQLHMAQLEGYKPRQYLGWIEHNITGLIAEESVVFIFALLSFIVIKIINYTSAAGTVIDCIWILLNLYFLFKGLRKKSKAKKPLAFTHRAIRLFILSLLLIIVWGFAGLHFSKNPIGFILVLSVVEFLLPVNMLLSAIIMFPVEMSVQHMYFKSAQKKIRSMKNLKVIGITGSYGKTSTKYFVRTILAEKYNTLMTPESYNTPMGITRIIREQLTDEHEIFVCEMGARNVGDIKTLCKLASPSIGILTSIGPQHLETFKSIENVAKTKYELIEALPQNGIAVFNGDNSYCMNLAKKTSIETLVYGIDNGDKSIFINAQDIKNSKKGLIFKIKGNNGIEFECQTRLFGKHNVSNILAAVSLALRLGLTSEEIKRGIEKIKPVPHRLELLDTNNGVTVIDDAFNSNPVGAREALETIKDLTDGNRIVITPGMVELGSIEYEENKKFGKVMARCCDYAILVGVKRSRPIVEGLREENFSEEKIIVTSNLNEATIKLGQIVRTGDVVLFENDLPDNYNEE